MELTHKILLALLTIASFTIFITENPIHSVLYLILSFVISAIILLMYGAEFIGLLFIMVYVGAIAVLFLFVIMMINAKQRRSTSWRINYLTLPATLVGMIFIDQFFFFNKIYSKYLYLDENYLSIPTISLDKISNIQAIGQVLFNEYYITVFIAGLILLVALIGGIVLTIEFKKKSSETSNSNARQLSKNKEIVHLLK
jgi:NADH-quinone oxidoreductase subunit J